VKFIAAILAVMALEWITVPLFPSVSWQISLGAKYLTVAILMQALWSASEKESLLLRTAITLLCCAVWVDLFAYIAWIVSDTRIDESLPIYVSFSAAMVYMLMRNYDVSGEEVNPHKITILLLKPNSLAEFSKAFFGTPISSICILADGYVWSFRSKSGVFEKTEYSQRWRDKHVAVNTRVEINETILQKLDGLVGKRRGAGIKCVFVLRTVLKEIGGKYAIKSWFDYIPGIYAARIINKKGG